MRAVAALFILAISLMAPPAHADGPSIAGSWYGEGQPNGSNDVWLAHLTPDGVFKVQFRSCAGQTPTVGLMEGRWKVTGTLMEMFIEKYNGQPRDYRDAYQILSNTGSTLRYKFTEAGVAPASFLGYIFTSSKVPDKFEIPGCNIMS